MQFLLRFLDYHTKMFKFHMTHLKQNYKIQNIHYLLCNTQNMTKIILHHVANTGQ